MPQFDCSEPAFFGNRAAKFGNDSTVNGIGAVDSPLGFLEIGKNAFMPDGTSVMGEFVQVGNAANVSQVFTNDPKTGFDTMCDVKTGREAAIVADGPVPMQITGSLRIGTDSFFGPNPTATAPPIAVDVAGRKVRVSRSAEAIAQITAPFAKSSFGRDASLGGCICSDATKSDEHITLTCPTP